MRASRISSEKESMVAIRFAIKTLISSGFFFVALVHNCLVFWDVFYLTLLQENQNHRPPFDFFIRRINAETHG